MRYVDAVVLVDVIERLADMDPCGFTGEYDFETGRCETGCMFCGGTGVGKNGKGHLDKPITDLSVHRIDCVWRIAREATRP